MVDIQQGALGALEHDVFAALAGTVQHSSHIGDHAAHVFAQLQGFIQGFLEIHRLGIVVAAQNEVVVIHHFAQLGGKQLTLVHITQAQAPASHLVFIGRADATAGGADFLVASGCFAGLIQCHVHRQDQRAGRRQTQALAYRHTLIFQATDFLEQSLQGKHHAVTDQALHIFTKNA